MSRRDQRERDVDREIQSHLDSEAEEQQQNGLPPEAARQAARRTFGNPTLIKEAVREMWGWSSLERFWQDLRFAARTLRKSPGFAFVAALSLGLGIGANTTMFSLVDGLWTRPMAVPKPSEVVRVFSVTTQESEGFFSYPEYLELNKQATAFSGLVARGGRGVRMPNPDGSLELCTVNVVSENFFSVLGVRAGLGRLFTPGDQDPIVILGNSFWKRRFGANPEIVGKQIEFERGRTSTLMTVAGVLPETFREIANGGDRDLWLTPQAWVSLAGRGDFENRGFRWFRVLGRLAPGASASSATAQVRTIAQRLASAWPETNAGRSARVITDASHRLQQAGTNGLLLLAVVLLLVLLCSVNVANLLLARGGARSKEIAVRLSLGAHRLRLVRQFMTENLVLGLIGLAAGLAIGAGLIKLLPSLLVQPPAFHPVLDFQLDFRVLSFSLAVSVLTILLFGLSPAWRTAKSGLVPALKGASGLAASGAGKGLRPRHWLVISQVGISLALLAATGVLVESFVNTRTMDYGLARKPLLLVWLQLSGPQAAALHREALDRLRGLPGVKAVAIASRAPLSLSEGGMSQRVVFPDQLPVEIKYNSVSSNYLPAIGTALRRGRMFDEVDQTSGAPVVLINETMAQRYWPREDAVGKTIRLEGSSGGEYRIVGVTQDAPINGIGEAPEPYLYLPYWRNPTDSMTYVLETSGDALALAQPARQKLLAISRQLDPLMITTEQELVRYSAGQYQVTAELVAVLGFIGLVLTAVGLYGVVSYGVSQRTRELGIRMALGAERGQMLKLILLEVASLGLIGMAFGLPLALTATRLASALLFGVSPWDVPLFAAAVLLLAIVLLIAGAVPARRAMRVDPLAALRYE
jgi:predicted permease